MIDDHAAPGGTSAWHPMEGMFDIDTSGIGHK
jgi:hypothetical protein